MAVFRRPAKNNYFTSKRTWMQDPRLRCKETGLLAKMLSMPPEWDFCQEQLASVLIEGADAIQAYMKSLCKLGYLVKLPQNRNNGSFGDVEYEVWDAPILNEPLRDAEVARIFSNSYTKNDFDEIYVPERLCNMDDSTPGRENPGSEIPGWVNPGQEVKQFHNLPTEEKKNNKPPAAAARAVVVFPIFDRIEIPKELKSKLSSKMDQEKAELLVKRVLAWKGRGDDAVACNTILKQWDTWADIKPAANRGEENRRWAQDNLRKYENQTIAGYRCMVMSKWVDFIGTGQSMHRQFAYDDPAFQRQITDLMNAILKKQHDRDVLRGRHEQNDDRTQKFTQEDQKRATTRLNRFVSKQKKTPLSRGTKNLASKDG